MDPLLVVLFIVGIVGVTSAVVFQVVMKRKRAEAAKRWAEAQGWEYLPENPQMVSELINLVPHGGYSEKVVDMAKGSREADSAFTADLQYNSDSGSGADTSTSTSRLGVAGLGLKHPLAQVIVTPKRALGGVSVAAGLKEAMTGDDQFDSAFRVFLVDEDAERLLLKPQVREYCLNHPKMPFAVTENWLVTWKKGSQNFTKVDEDFKYLNGLIVRLPHAQ